MVKRFVIWLIALSALASVVWVFIHFHGGAETTGDPYRMLSPGTRMIAEVSVDSSLVPWMDWAEAIGAHNLSRIEGTTTNPLAAWPRWLMVMDSLRVNNEGWRSVFAQSPVLFVPAPSLRSDAWSVLVGLSSHLTQTDIGKLMEAIAGKTSSRPFSGNTVYTSSSLQMVVAGQCLCLCSDASLAEEYVLKNPEVGSPALQQAFMQAMGVRGSSVPIHLFSALNDDGTGWIELDPTSDPHEMKLTGYAVLPEGQHGPWQAIGDPAPAILPAFLKNDLDYLDTYAYPDLETGWRQMEEVQVAADAGKYWGQAWKDLGDSCQCDLNAAALSWRTGAWSCCSAQLTDTTTAEFLVFQVDPAVDALGLMQPVLSGDSTKKCRTVKYPQLFSRNAVPTFPVQAAYVCQLGPWVFAGEDERDMEWLRNKYQLTDSMDRESQGESIGRRIYQRSWYVSPLPDALFRTLGGDGFLETQIQRFKPGRWSVSITWGAEKTEEERPVVVETPVQPVERVQSGEQGMERSWTVKNHKTGEKETVRVNGQNEMTLYGSKGEALWTKNLGAQPSGDIQQVDAYKNGKLQMVLVAGKKLFILDRNGVDLPGFPVALPSECTAPLRVLDYAGDRNYRLLVTCGRSLFNYSVEGKVTEGWKFSAASSDIREVLWKPIGGSDYLFIVMANGKTVVTRRNGVAAGRTTKALPTETGIYSVEPGKNLFSSFVVWTNGMGKQEKVSVVALKE